MKQKEIEINGKQYTVVFNLKTLSNFEEITNQGFFESKLNKTSEKMAIIVAAALAANEDTELTIKELQGNEDWEAYLQINRAYSEVMTLAAEFFPIPEVEKDKDPKPTDEEKEEGEKVKN